MSLDDDDHDDHPSVVSYLDSKIAVWPAVQHNDPKNYTPKFKHVLLFTKRLR
jgi:hypothetical protein